nr:hypothetical protein [Tanacetum cinerariifolium]
MGELTFFLGLQVKQKKKGIFISQDTYVANIFKKFWFFEVKTASTPMETQKPMFIDEDGEEVDVHIYRSMIVKRIFRYLKGQPKLGLWYLKDSPFDWMAYTDVDYAGASLDRKYTIEGCQFLGCRLISWQCKKQTVVANFLTEAEHNLLLLSYYYWVEVSDARHNLMWLGKLTTARVNAFQGGGDSLIRATTTASSLKAEQDSGNTDKTQTKATSNEPSSQGTSSGDGLRCQDTMRDTSAATSSSDDEALDKEDTSKHGRIDEIDADEDVALVSTHDDVSTQDNIDQDEGIEDVGEEEVVEVVTTAKMIIDTVVDASQVTIAIVDIPVSAVETIVTTASTITAESTKINVEVTQAPKRKGVMIQKPEETKTTKITYSQQPQVQDKGKRMAKLLGELEMPKKRKHQIRAEKELAEKQAKIDAEDRLARERESLKGTRSK